MAARVDFSVAKLLLATLTAAILIQVFECRTIMDDEIPMVKREAKNESDPFAQEAADVLDSTLLLFKNSLANLIEDSSKLSDIFTHMSDSIIRYAPHSNNQSDIYENTHNQLKELTHKANKTLIESSFD